MEHLSSSSSFLHYVNDKQHTHTRNISLIILHLTTPPSSGWSLAIPLLCNISCRTALYVIPRNPINLIDPGRLWSPQLYDTVPTKYLKHRKLQHWLLSNNILSLIWAGSYSIDCCCHIPMAQQCLRRIKYHTGNSESWIFFSLGVQYQAT